MTTAIQRADDARRPRAREPQHTELFIGQANPGLPVKDDQDLMAFPFFSLSKRPRYDPIEYVDGSGRTIRIEAGPKGMATIWDAELINYAVSLINEALEKGEPVSNKIRFKVGDFLRFANRGTGGNKHQRFREMLERLNTTRVKTNIERDGRVLDTAFHLIDSYALAGKRTRNGIEPGQCEIAINEWFFGAMLSERQVLTVNRAYFKLTSGLARKIYQLARKHAGANTWECGLHLLHKKCGATEPVRNFKGRLQKLIENDAIPDYLMMIRPAGPHGNGYGHGAMKVVFMKRHTPDEVRRKAY